MSLMLVLSKLSSSMNELDVVLSMFSSCMNELDVCAQYVQLSYK